MEQLESTSTENNIKIAKRVLEIIRETGWNIILLKGDLGSGKTSLTSTIAKILKTKNRVASPTFVIQKIYKLANNELGFKQINHFDLYRLINLKDITDIGFFEELENLDTLNIIEWPELVEESLKNFVKIEISESEDGGRIFKILKS
ncbi:tRNA (adenosine(37)-N6)-threonylcarbamoyltransferase complex ATPase subunit type 1 TsaE [Patescibacteria group bacterium]|nr:tRNA (adenosine(37)-N6)-threonylcarbamoyltransferase complex ATPase subunit type 1 TsaE [Patescibacteria group bacterium]